MKSMWLKRGGAAAVLLAAMLSSGCGEFVRQSRSPSQLVVISILTSRGTGATTLTFVSGPLTSDVPGVGETVFNDFGQVSLSLMLRDGAQTTGPTALNAVTISRYRVVYRRSDGLNTPGVHVPHPIDGAVTFTVVAGTTAVAAFELVRHDAKREAPLRALGVNPVVLTTIADVTFYGRDQAGNEVSATGSVQISFGNFI